MVIFVLSLLGLLAAPVLANVLAGSDSVIGPKPPGGTRLAGVEDPVQMALLPEIFSRAGVEDPVQIALMPDIFS